MTDDKMLQEMRNEVNQLRQQLEQLHIAAKEELSKNDLRFRMRDLLAELSALTIELQNIFDILTHNTMLIEKRIDEIDNWRKD